MEHIQNAENGLEEHNDLIERLQEEYDNLADGDGSAAERQEELDRLNGETAGKEEHIAELKEDLGPLLMM